MRALHALLTKYAIPFIFELAITMFIPLRKSLSFIPLCILCLALKPDAASFIPPLGRMNLLPARTLWVWERPEDLRTLDPHTTAIAILDRTILLGHTATVIPRRQSFAYPAGITRIAVVRIEAPGFIGSDLEEPAADLILDALADPNVAALQVDFDARRSQRAFYVRMLRDLRRRMPSELPLSITALASWCSSDDWLGGLPIDEAVPMFFRMEPDRHYVSPDLPQFRIREPLCMGSIGISTREQHSASLAGKRIYIFPDRGWREDLPLITENNLAERTSP
ncbi:MAG: DUF3142 domain-containing protein [Terracidiphilus sp.]|jgi:hypothetical protein